ncbi:YebC/PmpR family DNA-binding transcriptional regulator [Saprospira sp. CCB-QB6]|uniref:YebC/PmpR family DNA-binding transcriptional regulator n=1 Tax=Saprospira sp. CCB-QB6 TaxID=3023936 RepID=UPI00234AACAD|nr:YebC/PmpR family DNA-binding transcriptional regulator [Saprospira sp. CCB-QB6]WCL82360.1 YebC/PmpR family DNA-binding transcriptional regulator [Saprospira sp. CCB-QB6]
MGRAFEYRKERKMKRWGQMAKVFTKIGREIALAVKEGGPDPENNPKLRMAIQNAKVANMPKKNVEAAIQRATSKDAEDLQEVIYEGYGPHGIAFIIETLTDNPTRTVANIRFYFSRSNGSLGTSGSVSFMFDRQGEFIVDAEGLDMEELELELIDGGAEEIEVNEDQIYIYTAFEDFGNMQAKLEELGIEVKEASLQRFANASKQLDDPDQIAEIENLIDKFEDDDDVQKVFHSMEI